MARYDSSTAEIIVFTFKDGLLSAVAHDLKLRATQFVLEIQGDQVRLALEANSLRVVNAMKEGLEQPETLSSRMRGEIERTAAKEVLAVHLFPTIQFTASTVNEREVTGQLTLHGHTRPVRGTRSGNSVEFEIDQREFGIRPYQAMLGALKVKPHVKVRVSISTL